MTNYREIVTKAIVSKGKKTFTSSNSIMVNNDPSTILGCWIINHNFGGTKSDDQITINGSYDVNIWYSYDNDTKTDVVRETNTYNEVIKMHNRENVNGEEVIVRSLKQPNCVKIDIDGNKINYTVEKELGVELVGDIKMKIEANMDEEPWDEIVEESSKENLNDIDSVNDSYISDTL